MFGASDAAGHSGFFTGPEFGASTEISEDEGMRLFCPGGKLRLEESSQEEAPVGQIERTHFVARAASSHAQSGGFPSRHVFRIGLEITEILAPQGIRSAQLMHE